MIFFIFSIFEIFNVIADLLLLFWYYIILYDITFRFIYNLMLFLYKSILSDNLFGLH
jgi:hypothetical protein